MKFQHLLLAVAAACGASAQAADSINLANYSVTGTYALDAFNSTSGGLSGLEASAVTPAIAARCSLSATKALAWSRSR
jgi:hypothetical protein